MKLFLNILAACLTLFSQVIIFEETEWGIRYLNAHPHLFKPLPLFIGLAASLFFTCTISPISNAKYGFKVGTDDGKSAWNPFWGWLTMCVIVTLIINMMLE